MNYKKYSRRKKKEKANYIPDINNVYKGQVTIHKDKENVKDPTSFDFWLDSKGFLKQYRTSIGWVIVAVLTTDNDYFKCLHEKE
jgi:hypothetical protein